MLDGTRQRLLVYHVVMASRKPKVNEIDAGGGAYPGGYGSRGSGVRGRFNKAVNEKSGDIGYGVGQSYFDSKVAAIKTPSGAPKTVTTRGDVYTPGGMYQGKEVFIQKPALTDRQVAGVVQGQVTKAGKQAAQISGAAKTGAKIMLKTSAVPIFVAGHGSRDIVEGLKTVVNKIRESDKLPKSKAPKKR
jgi:hypothetical protein